jgi:hypothetical protein
MENANILNFESKVEKRLDINNDLKENFCMPNVSTIDKVIYSTHFLAFCKQSVKGSIMGISRFYSDEGKFIMKSREEVRDILRDGNFVFKNYFDYLNSCWKAYFTKSDEYVTNKISLMLKHGHYLHESCLFTHIWEFCDMLLFYVLARIDLPELKDIEFLSECIEIIMDAILSYHVDNLMIRDNFCDTKKCEVFEYKQGEDFIKMDLIKNKN